QQLGKAHAESARRASDERDPPLEVEELRCSHRTSRGQNLVSSGALAPQRLPSTSRSVGRILHHPSHGTTHSQVSPWPSTITMSTARSSPRRSCAYARSRPY